MTDASPSACILIIGNEILSGKTQDKNIKFLGEELAKKGISLKEARIFIRKSSSRLAGRSFAQIRPTRVWRAISHEE